MNQKEDTVSKPFKRFMGPLDLFLSPFIELLIFLCGLGAAGYLIFLWGWDVGWSILVGFIVFQLISLLMLNMIRFLFPFREGVYWYDQDTWKCWIFSIHGILFHANLYLIFFNSMIPFIFRKFFYRLAGCKFGPGIIPISGKMADPSLTQVDASAILGDECLILCHSIGIVNGRDMLFLARVHIGERAIIGARAVIMPGVMVGIGAMVSAGSVVLANTKIGDGEIWAGNPAKKIA